MSRLIIFFGILLTASPLLRGESGDVLIEKWRYLESSQVEDLYQSPHFYEDPFFSKTLATTDYRDFESKQAVRMRGYLVAPSTGRYRFWLSAQNGAELWISTDARKVHKRRIIHFSDERGGTSAANPDGPNRWDHKAEQAGSDVFLKKGERYFFEAYTQVQQSKWLNLAIAWAPPGQKRELLPLKHLEKYRPEKNDRDDDSLPDAWEKKHGLNPRDNGRVQITKEGERGDYDQDGLSNREEFLHGTNPRAKDSDDDGLSDGEEIHSYLSNPLQADAPAERSLGKIPLTQYDGMGFLWEMTEQGLVPEEFRGRVRWEFEAPASGYYALNFRCSLKGQRFFREEVEIKFTIGEKIVDQQAVIFYRDRETLIRLVTPHLAEGRHQLTLNIDNVLPRRKVILSDIEHLQPEGPDSDGDGFPDWVNRYLRARDFFRAPPKETPISPAFFEGRGHGLIRLNGKEVETGFDPGHWYSNLPLKEASPTHYRLDDEPGFVPAGVIHWTNTDIFKGGTITIRQNDSLKLTATPPKENSKQPVILTLPTVKNWAVEPGTIARQSSDLPGCSAAKAIDDYRSLKSGALSHSHTAPDAKEAWWELEFVAPRWVSSVTLWNYLVRKHGLTNFRMSLLSTTGETLATEDFHTNGTHVNYKMIWDVGNLVAAKKLRIERLGPDRDGKTILALAEVEIFGAEERELRPDEPHVIQTFSEGGTFVIKARQEEGPAADLKVVVKEAAFEDEVRQLIRGSITDFTLAHDRVSTGLFFEAGDALPNLKVTGTGVDQGKRKLRVAIQKKGEYRLLARLHRDGPILGSKPLNITDLPTFSRRSFSEAAKNQQYPNLLFRRAPFYTSSLPEGGRLDVRIIDEDITFVDGKKSKTFRSSDLSHDLGFLHCLFPQGSQSDGRMEFRVYDSSGQLVGRR